MSDVTKLSRRSPAAECIMSIAALILTLSYFLWVYYPTMSVSASRAERSASAMASDAPQQPPVTVAREASPPARTIPADSTEARQPPPAGDAHPAPKPAAEQTGTTQHTEMPERKPDTGYSVIILKSVFDNAELYRHVCKDIETHPLLKKHDLVVHIVKVENGYVRLTVLTGGYDLTHRLANPPTSAAEAAFTEFGPQYQALHRLAEAIAKNEACKGVFWEEIRWVKARRLFHEALRAFDDEIGATKENWPHVLADPKIASMIGKAFSGDYVKRNVPPPEWLEKFEVALKDFPAQEQAWKQLKGRLVVAGSDEEIYRALQDAQELRAVMPVVRVAGRDGRIVRSTRDWGDMCFRIEQTVRGSTTRSARLRRRLQ